MKPFGIWPKPDEDGFVVANRNIHVERALEGTPWCKARWQPVLRRLPGAVRTHAMRFETAPAVPVRGVFLSSVLLDRAG